MSTDSFINALRCFLCIRREVHSIYCDNGTNLVRVNNEFVKLLSQTDPTLLSYFTEHNIEFVIKTPSASNQGGVWERQIPTAKMILEKVFLRQEGPFDTAMLKAALYKAAATMNSRPLSAKHINNSETLPITLKGGKTVHAKVM